MPPSINDIHLHRHNWVPQAPFPPMDNTVIAANQALNSPPIFGIPGVPSYRGPSQGSSSHPIIHCHGSAAGHRGSVGASSSSPYPGSNGPSLSRFIVPRQQQSSNSPSPVVTEQIRCHCHKTPMSLHAAGAHI
uniref:Uncharacterized protein n=1 Tax=Davidia involucrata TaxID=16924 RepID=A0A5B6ZHW5_DAVIN